MEDFKNKNYNYTGLFLSVYLADKSSMSMPLPLTGVAPSGGNDHITIAYFGESKANELKDYNKSLIATANEKFLNTTCTIDNVMLNSFKTKRKEFVDGKVVVTQETRHDILYLVDSKTSTKLDEFRSTINEVSPRRYPFHISKEYYWDNQKTREEVEVRLAEVRNTLPIKIRIGAAYDD